MLAFGATGADAQRIVSTAPSITETLFAMGLGPHVVGVTIYCKFPPAVIALPKIGTYLQPDIEAIVALHPDLVVVQQQSNRLGDELARLHIAHVDVKSDNLADIYAGAEAIGKAANNEAGAQRFVHDTQLQLTSLSDAERGLKQPSVAFIVGHESGSLQGLFAGAGKSYFSDLLRYAGGANVFFDAATAYPTVSMEEMLKRNPDFIIELGNEDELKEAAEVALWRKWPSLKAVQMAHVYVVGPGPFLVPGPRVVEAVKQLLHLLHPEVAR